MTLMTPTYRLFQKLGQDDITERDTIPDLCIEKTPIRHSATVKYILTDTKPTVAVALIICLCDEYIAPFNERTSRNATSSFVLLPR